MSRVHEGGRGARHDPQSRAVRAWAKAMKRDPDKPPQEVDAYYRPRIAAEQAKRLAAGLPKGGRMSSVEGPRARAPLPRERSCGAFYPVSARTLPYKAQTAQGGPWAPLGRPRGKAPHGKESGGNYFSMQRLLILDMQIGCSHRVACVV